MTLHPLQVNMAVHDMPLPHFIALLVFLVILAAFIFVNGITLKLGDKEITIGGLKRLFTKRDADIAVSVC